MLIAALALVVIYTSRGAFFSPLAVVVVSAIGLVAVLLQLRFRHDLAGVVHAPVLLNALGVAFALVAMFGDLVRLSSQLTELMALGAVGCFAISSALVLDAIRKHRPAAK